MNDAGLNGLEDEQSVNYFTLFHIEVVQGSAPMGHEKRAGAQR